MAFIGLTVPIDIASQLSSLYEDGDKTPLEEMHVTLCFLGKKMDNGSFLEALHACYSAAVTNNPIKITAAVLSTFPPNPDDRNGVPVIVRVVSEDLIKFRAELTAMLDSYGVEYSKKFPVYKPHITLAYGPEQFTPRQIKPLSWMNSYISLWGGKEFDDGHFARFKLGKSE